MQVPRTVVAIVVILIVLLGGFSAVSFFSTDTNEFSKKQECAKYIPGIEKGFEESAVMAPDFSTWANSRLLEMFYSEKRDSCVYSWERSSASGDTWIFSYFLVDALSGEQLLNTTPLIVGQADFDQKKQAFFDAVSQLR